MATKNKAFKRVKPSLTSEELLAQIEERNKFNKGGFTAEGFDVNSTFTPTRVSDRTIANASGVGNNRFETPEIRTNADLAFALLQIPEFQVPEAPPAEEGEMPIQGQASASDFIQYFTQQVSPGSRATNENDKRAIENETGLSFFVQPTQDGGALFSDGIIRYNDGTVREYKQDGAYEVASLQDRSGSVYSDGTIRRKATTGEFVTQENISRLNGGLNGLLQGLFGEDYRTTQDYGNVTSAYGYKGNIHKGTDIVTNSDFLLPVDAKVLQVFQDDGTRWGDSSGHQGFGNSILVQLSSGERLRFSHMANPVQFQEGDVIPAYVAFGKQGETGNAYGTHLDLMYYDAEGNVADPSMFSGFAPAENNPFTSEALMAVKTALPNIKEGTSQYQGPEIKQYSDVQQPQPQQPVQEPQAQYSDIIKPELQNTQINQAPRPVMDTVQAVGNVLGQGIEKANLTGDKGFGVSELLQGDKAGAAEEINRTNPTGQFDLGITERLQNNPELGNQALSGTFERATENLPTRGKFDLGISEAMRGDKEGSQRVRQATFENIDRKIQEGVGSAQEFARNFLNQFKQENLPQPGQILGAKTAYASERTPSMVSMNNEFGLKIGDSPTNTLMSSQMTSQPGINVGENRSVRQAEGKSDIRDPFFTSGQADKYVSYLGENADQRAGGALDTSLFDKSFYERRDAEGDIKNVFSSTSMYQPAQKQFTDYRARENDKALNEWRSKYSDPMFYDQNEVNKLYNQLKSQSGSSFININTAPKPTEHKPSLEDYLRIGKTAAQWYAETGRQSELDALGADPRNNIDLNTGQLRGPNAILAPSSDNGYGHGNSNVNIPSGSVSNQQFSQGKQNVANVNNYYNQNPNSLSNRTQIPQYMPSGVRETFPVAGGNPQDFINSVTQQESIFDKAKKLFQRIF